MKVLALSALCVAAQLVTGPMHAQIVPITIVSAGDSYASGEGAPDLPGTGAPVPRWLGDNRDKSAVSCHRSNNAAPAFAAKLVGSMRPASFVHVACSGAQIGNLEGLTGQLATAAAIVGGPIDALILSIGGNDVGFAAVVESCLATPCELFGPAAFPGPVFALSPKLSGLVTAVAAMPVPVRHVFVTEYPDPSTTPYPGPDHRCGSPFPPGTPNIPGSGFEGLDFTKAETASATVIVPLNLTLLTTVASAPGLSPPGGPVWHYVAGISAAFESHGYCMGLPNPAPQMWVTGRMVNTLTDSELIQGDDMGTMHPNTSGQSAAAAVIATAIMAAVPIVTMPGTPTAAPPTTCKNLDAISCPGFCNRHPGEVRCRKQSDECLNRHLPGCKD